MHLKQLDLSIRMVPVLIRKNVAFPMIEKKHASKKKKSEIWPRTQFTDAALPLTALSRKDIAITSDKEKNTYSIYF